MSLKLVHLTLATAVLAISVNGLAVPQSQGDAFSVNAYTPSTPEEFDPAAEIQRLEAKYPSIASGNTKEARAVKQAGSVKVKPNDSGLSFFVPTVIGNQTFQLIYDTGSADLWILSKDMPPWQADGHPTYEPTSSSKLLPNHTWAIKYAGGEEISGVVYTDTVKAGPVVAHNQAVQAAVDNPFSFESDGILGLAFGVINTVKPDKQKTFFETAMPTLKRKLFAANLRFKGKMAYTPVTSEKHWSMNASSYAVGKGAFTDSKKTIGEVIVDSGTSLVYLPEAVVKDYYSHIKGYELQQGGSYTFPCNSDIPDFHFKTAGMTLSIPGRDVNYTTYDPTRGICAGGITTLLNKRYSVLGNLFMKNYYVVHSQEKATPELGFALH
ncbi:probable aspartic proteinase precursor [Fusarium torulosum]|uniref:Probable aspartic proteinase n=1 Tax=Fusarium torulosum TaxID=33205 RepID=A0AAE8MKS6_9HYPO|nr:probable aspartic proteinase precursor [Fusarium torulosum]